MWFDKKKNEDLRNRHSIPRKNVMGRRSYTEAFYLHIFSLGSLDGIKKNNNNIILQSSSILVALQPSICCMIVVG